MERIFDKEGIGMLIEWMLSKIRAIISSDLGSKQDKLVSGTNIKTINGTSLLGEGDVSIGGGSGGGDFDSSGTYPNLTAGKATKLATARKIGITGAAVGTATNFDGSAAVNIPVTKIDESYIIWTTSNKRARGSVTDNLMKNGQQNSFAFMPPDAVAIEYTNDSGATWLDYGLTADEKTTFLTPLVGTQTLRVGKDGADLADTAQLRITLDFIKAGMLLELRKIMLYVQTFSGTANGSVRIKILRELYENYDADIWDEFIDVDVVSPGWMSLPVTDRTDATWGYKGSGTAYPAKLRVIFYRTGTPIYNTALINMVGLSSYVSMGNHIAKYSWPCTMDVEKNATFPAKVTATKHVTQGGTSNQVVLGDGTLKALSEIGKTYSVVTTSADGLMSKGMYAALKDGFITNIVNVTTNESNVELSYNAAYPNADGTFNIAEGEGVEIPLATTTTAGVMSAKDKIKLDGFDGFNTAKDYVGADVADGVYGRNNYIDLSGKGLNEGDIIIVTHKNGNYVAYAMLIWTDGGMLVIKSESTPATTISTQHPYIIFSSVQDTDEITVRKIHTTRL